MSILVRREQEKYLFRLKTSVNYGTVKLLAGAEVSRFEVSSLGLNVAFYMRRIKY